MTYTVHLITHQPVDVDDEWWDEVTLSRVEATDDGYHYTRPWSGGRKLVYRLCPGCGKKGVRWCAHVLVCMYCGRVESS